MTDAHKHVAQKAIAYEKQRGAESKMRVRNANTKQRK